ncbi:hypothetical protein BVG19_g3237 [[Candida] boidinii]|nr:hypothetical protein BVG19_g3237 [[Candida] boidinii]OWB51223.1 hypothetical protein B5S27_g2782 [[Candida] boidinii]
MTTGESAIPLNLSSSISSLNELDVTQYIPPWKSPYIIGVAGVSGSGKTTVAQQIIEEINQPWTVLVSLDNFYKPLTKEQSAQAFRNEYDFDTPDALDLDLLYECINSLKKGEKAVLPVYSFATHSRTKETITIYGCNVIIIEGIYSLYHSKLLDIMDMKIYVDTDLDICYSRRLLRDIVERGRDLEGIIKQWDTFVKPNSERFVKPSMLSADIIIPRGSDNLVAMNTIITHIRKQLKTKSAEHVQHLIKLGQKFKTIDYNRVHILPKTNQLEGMCAILLNKQSSRDEFIFYFDRVALILIDEALELIHYSPIKETKIITPGGYIFKNAMRQSQEVVAVNMIRSGDCFMSSLRKTIPEVKVGKLLIQQDSQTGEPQLHTEKLPPLVNGNNVLLFDAQTISGAASIMAIKIMIDHGINEEDIILVTFFSTEIGVRRILNAFGKVNIVIGKMGSSNDTDTEARKSEIGYCSDNDWWMSTRFIDAIYFGTD